MAMWMNPFIPIAFCNIPFTIAYFCIFVANVEAKASSSIFSSR